MYFEISYTFRLYLEKFLHKPIEELGAFSRNGTPFNNFHFSSTFQNIITSVRSVDSKTFQNFLESLYIFSTLLGLSVIDTPPPSTAQ